MIISPVDLPKKALLLSYSRCMRPAPLREEAKEMGGEGAKSNEAKGRLGQNENGSPSRNKVQIELS